MWVLVFLIGCFFVSFFFAGRKTMQYWKGYSAGYKDAKCGAPDRSEDYGGWDGTDGM